jgi:hypothetical protein
MLSLLQRLPLLRMRLLLRRVHAKSLLLLPLRRQAQGRATRESPLKRHAARNRRRRPRYHTSASSSAMQFRSLMLTSSLKLRWQSFSMLSNSK